MTSPWIPVFGAALTQFLWEAAAVALVVLAVQPLLRRGSAAARYVLDCMALFSLPILFALTVAHYAAAGAGAASAVTAEPLVQPFAAYIVMVWLSGIVVCGGYAAAGFAWAQGLRRAERSAAAAVPAVWRTEMEQLAGRLHLRRRVCMQVSARISGPCTLGWLRPVILLPLSALTALPAEQLRALLAHELAHIRRHDYLVNLVQRGVEVLFFFHPAVWWLSQQVSEEREHCCDDAAVAVCGDRALYARALVDLAARQTAARVPSAAMAAGGGSLSHRVTRLLGHPAASRARMLRTAVALLLIASTGVWLLGASAQTIPPAPALPTAPAAPTAQLARVPLVQEPMAPPRSAQRQTAPVRSEGAGFGAVATIEATYVTFTLSTVQACTSQPEWVPGVLPSGLAVLRLEMIPHCVPVIRPVEVFVLSNSI
ncbi:MAG: M56 family metallopeptidase [Acidobacteria bacterium]|nr:MAG: M56 family metallopeptidase [Acidobacteriota bacterium]